MRLPIIYVRGFAGSSSGIDRAVDDPFYGFNEGSVHVRVGKDQPRFYQFESPLLRLMVDPLGDGGEPYQLRVRGGQQSYLESQPDGCVPWASIWIHRFYDEAASTFGRDPQQYTVTKAAESLLALVELVKAKTGAPRVHLVAHSMGGLICRSMIQRVVPERTGRPDGAVDHVERLFTYGTPHGGIEFSVGFGLVERLRDFFDVNGAAIFGPQRMYEYLTPGARPGDDPPEGWRAEHMPEDGFPVDRVFCLVGTNPADYDVALGASSRAVGARSDGLVQVDNAYVPGAHRAFVHRSHSGRYGLVNSEEGYQNLSRFLLGDLEIEVELHGLRVRGSREDEIVWQLETQLAIRGLPIVMHEQTTAHHCPVQVEWPTGEDTAERPVPLVTTFLSSRLGRPRGPDGGAYSLRHALGLRLLSVREEGGVFGFGDHLEQTPDFSDTLVVDFVPGNGTSPPRAWATWNSDIPGALRDWEPDGAPLTDEAAAEGVWQGSIPFPPFARKILGENATIRLRVTGRGQPLPHTDPPAGAPPDLLERIGPEADVIDEAPPRDRPGFLRRLFRRRRRG